MDQEYERSEKDKKQNNNHDESDKSYFDSLDYIIDKRIIKMYDLEFKEFK